MIVAKFGGSSLACGEGFRRVIKIIKDNDIPVVIVSAPGGKPKVTDLLLFAYKKWELYGSAQCEEFDEVKRRFSLVAKEFGLSTDAWLTSLQAAISSGCGYDYALSRGEYFTAKLLAKAIGYEFLDATECVKLTMDGKVDLRSTCAHAVNIRTPCVIPGFYGKLPSGKIKLLPRGGSDVSGAAIAAALKAKYVKWTDVDGIYDGRGGVIKKLSYDEAELLCYFGATVVQYESMKLLKAAKTELIIKNTFFETSGKTNDMAFGTIIGKQACDGFALSSKNMYFAQNLTLADEREILRCGLKIPFKATLMGKTQVIVDDCGFSPEALKRILKGKNVSRATITATVGAEPNDFFAGKKLYSCKSGSLYVNVKT